ncbi:MAG: SDR family oxidoreductase [Nonomuraea sp.]|nr:SDR family oxidoreductase [Nonomuraea sp.]
MDMQLTGKTALVTGASKGIGLAIVRALTAEGMHVTAAARTAPPELEETGATIVRADLSSAAGVRELSSAVGDLDLLVNNLGGGDTGGEEQTGGFLDFTDEHWLRDYEFNFLSTVRLTRDALPGLLRRRGAVVNISSVGARMPRMGPITYTTSKSALTAFGKAVAEEFGPQGVRVNTISPAAVRTAMWEAPDGYGAALAARNGVPQELLLAGLPSTMGMTTGNLVEPSEVAALVTYLASPHAASITGADYLIDGGSIKTV